MTSTLTNLAILTFGFMASLTASAKTIRIDSIAELKNKSFQSTDIIELNTDIELENFGENKSADAKVVIAFLAKRTFSNFVVDSKNDGYYYRLVANSDLDHLSHLERLGPNVRTKVSALILSHGHD